MNDSQGVTDYWRELRDVLLERLAKPLRSPTFVFYFFTIILVVGAFGIIEPVIRYFLVEDNSKQLDSLAAFQHYHDELTSAFYTYFVAIAATAVVDLILFYHKQKHLMMFFLFSALIVFIFAILAAIKRESSAGLGFAIIGYVLSLLLWWIANAENVHLLDQRTKPTNALGGNPESPTHGVMGEIKG
jgi:hypothetical protein